MIMRKSRALLVAALVMAAAAVTIVATAGASAPEAIANITPTKVKLHQTGTTVPGASWTPVGQLQLPVGSWAVEAHLNAYSSAAVPASVECYLLAPGAAPGHATVELGTAKGTNAQHVSLLALTNAPNGGSANLVCKVGQLAADRKVFAQGIVVAAIAVNGTSVTHLAPPATFAG